MFNYKKYQQGYYGKNRNLKHRTIHSINNTMEKVNKKDEQEIKRDSSYSKSDFMKISHKRSQFYKSRRCRKKKNKTVRFSENLEEKYIIHDNINNSFTQTNESVDSNDTLNNWDISIDFEELV